MGSKKPFAMKSSWASTVNDRELWSGAAAATAKSTGLLRGGFAICEKIEFENALNFGGVGKGRLLLPLNMPDV